jgi:hypothetical protein
MIAPILLMKWGAVLKEHAVADLEEIKVAELMRLLGKVP